jgi:succinoglycan biosynthesis transport protein ExoP
MLRSLRRRIGVIVLCCVLVPASAFAFSQSQTKQYTASASLLFRDPGFDQKLFGSQAFAPSQDPAREAATNVKLVSLDVVAQRTARRLPEARPVKNKVAVSPEGQSDVVGLSATYPNPRLAARVANTFAEEYIAFRREADRAKIAEARGLVERRIRQLSPADQGAQARSLRGQLEQLDILASLQTGNAELAEAAAVPTSPSSPKTVRNTGLGVFLGLLLGVGLALLFERLDRRVRDPKEIEEIFGRPILGAIPNSRTLDRSGPAQEALPAKEDEAFRMLRANLRYFNIDRGDESVLITSAAPGDGKSTVAWNLAAAAAGAGSRVLLIEADLRNPALATNLGLYGTPGLSTVLSGEADMADVVQQIPVQASANGRGARTVDVLLAGPLPPNPADLLESDRMSEVIRTGESKYDLLVIDTPPASVVSDAIPLVNQVGGVIVVSRLARTTREAATHLRNQLRNLDAPVLGVVVNATGSDSEAYGYGYSYAYAAGSGDEKVGQEPVAPRGSR